MKNFIYIFIIALTIVGCSSSSKIRVNKSNKNSHKVSSKVGSTKTPVLVSNSTSNTASSSSTVLLEATSKTTVTTDLVLKYIDSFKGIAKDNMINHKIPASITMAQGILESGSGTGALAMNANNHFGIKCHTGWTGESVRHDDDAAQECFRKYVDPAESYRDHSLFLTSRARYNNLFKLNITDYKAWARGLKSAGYATDPKYPDKLISLIERYKLNELDSEVSVTKITSVETIKNIDTNSNPTSTYVVNIGDTLYSISRKLNTTVQNIKTLNNLSSDILNVGQILKF